MTHRNIRRLIYCALSLGLLFALFSSIRLARADYASAQPDLPSIARACRLAPTSAAYWLRSSALREIDQPHDPAVDAAVNRALELNPRYTEARMQRALRDEIHGHLADAERDYLNAAATDRMYKPAWALANFYIRQGNMEKFWLYARKCLEVVEPRRLEPVSYNPAPVFDLAWRVTRDPAEIRRKLIPPRHFILIDYLEYLRSHGLADYGVDIAMDLVAYADHGDTFDLLNFCELLVNMPDPGSLRNRSAHAVKLWNALADRNLIPSGHLDPAHGQSLTNPDLKRPFERVGFDWRLPPAEGISQNHFPDSGEVRFEFDGEQPDDVLMLYQSIPVVPSRSYRLSFRNRTLDMDNAYGLAWQVWDYAGQQPLPVSGALTSQREWTRGEARFAVPKGVSIVRLGLVYRRANGSTRIHGTAAFSDFALHLDEAPKS